MPSIYERIGGASAVAAAVDDLYARIMRDRVLAPYFERIDLTRQKRQLADQAIAQATDRVIAHLVAALAGLGVAAADIDAIAVKLAPLRAQIVAA